MNKYRILVVNTPVGAIGSGEGGGVELTLVSLVSGLLARGHRLTILACEGSKLPPYCKGATLKTFEGKSQSSWQHHHISDPIIIPNTGLLPRLWSWALQEQKEFDLILNLAYDWLPFWITPYVSVPIFHLVSMGSVSEAMDQAINDIAQWDQRRLSFHTLTQASDFKLPEKPTIVSSGLNINNYQVSLHPDNYFGWVGRITPEKGLEDAAITAASLGIKLKVWGIKENILYADRIEKLVPPNTINWEGFLPTTKLQEGLSKCQGLFNTPKWNEAFGNVVIEAMACGVPVLSYNRGGPGELVEPGINGWLVPPDDVMGLRDAAIRIKDIDRSKTRKWAENHFSLAAFAARLEKWLEFGLSSL